MAYAFSVTRVTITGDCFSGLEHWTTGFYVGYVDAGASNPTQTAVDNIAARWTTFFQNSSSNVSTNYRTLSVKMAQLTTSGATMLNNVVYYNYGTPIAGASSGTDNPPQIALVATLTTNTPRGIGSKGRMFLPGIRAAVDSTAHISSTTVGTIATNFQTFLNGVNTDLGVAGDIILASKGRATGTPVAPVNTLVTGIKLGNVYDTQRRRRNELNEVYTSKTIS